MDETLISREELSQTLLAILDIRENTARMRDILEESEPDGEDAEEEA